MNKSQKEKFTLIGAGGHAKVIIEIIEESDDTIAEIIDQNPDSVELAGYPVTRKSASSESVCIIAVGNNVIRKRIASEENVSFGKAIHPSANISRRAFVDTGTVIMAGVSVNASVRIGKHCIINTNASIDHDCLIDDFVHVSPGASLAGNVTVGEGSHIGIGSSIIQGITIGKWATIGAGSVIIENVPDYAVVVGVPGKLIKYNNQ